MADAFLFEPMRQADLPRVAAWRAAPHVAQWWGEPEAGLSPIAEHLGDPAVDAFIVHIDGRPAGYLQSYDPHAWPGHHFGDGPPGSRGLDMFIGEAGLVGKGYGSALTRAFVERLFAAGVPCAFIDPHPSNARAIRAYEKAGFAAYARRQTPWGPALLMSRPNDASSGQRSAGWKGSDAV